MTAPALVGRAAELDALRALVDRAHAGHGALALVRGEAGIGKSALVTALAPEAEARGFAVVVGRAWEFAEAPPYFPLWPCLRALGIDPAAATGFALWERVVTALAAATARQPVAWIVEDVHAADEQTLELLCFLAQSARAMRAALVLTARPRDPRLSERSGRILARAAREGLALDLGPLSDPDVVALAARVARLAPASAARLVELSGGNPLYAVECARALRAGDDRADPLPPTVRDLVLEQLARLPEASRATVVAGAVFGREFTAALVARVLGVLPARAIDDLAPALSVGLVEERAPGRFAFAHALTREAVYRSVGATARRDLHALAELALGAGDDDARVIERAHHALESVTPEREARALDLALRAVRLAEARGAADRAFALARRAHEVRLELGSPVGPDDDLELARLAQAAGRRAEAERLAHGVIAGAREPATLGRAALRLGAELRPGVVDRELVRALEESLAALDGGDAALRCRVRARLAAALQPAPDPQGPVAMARAAIAEAEALGDPALRADALFYGGSALADYAPPRERMERAAELLSLARAAGQRPRALTALARLLMDAAEQGDFASFDRHLDELTALADEVGHPRLTWRATLLGSMRALAGGDFALAERLDVQVEELAGLADDPALTLSFAAHRLHRSRVTYRDDLVRECLAGVHAVMVNVPDAPLLEALLAASAAAWMGDRGAAAAALAPLPVALPLPPDQYFVFTAAEAVAAGGTPEQARALLDRVRRWDNVEHVGGHVVMSYDGPVARLRGLLLGAAGDLAGAERELRDALSRVRAHGFRPWVARVAMELAAVLREAGRGAEAAGLLDEARALAAALELSGLAALVDRARGAVGAPERAAAAGAARPSVSLRCEGDVWAIAWGERTIRVKDSRGMQLVARLVERPDEELHALALASDEGASAPESDAGAALDATAARAYRERMRELEARLEAAAGTPEAAGLERERAFLAAELSRAFGLRGERRSGSASERARVNVQRRIRDAIRRVAEVDASAGAYFERAIRTGTFCSFRP